MGRKLFSEYNRLFYRISVAKGVLIRDMRDQIKKEPIARTRQQADLPYIVKSHRSLMLRKLAGVDMVLQENKAVNLRIASARLDGILIRPGEVFSFWKLVGRCTRKKGYREGLTISGSRLGSSVGGGLCQLANMVHYLVLHSPLTVTELHHHSDALFPDSKRNAPFGTGTSIFYNYVDYRFCNRTGDVYQLKLWTDGADLCGELHSSAPVPCRYRLSEEGHHFSKEADGYYRNSRIIRTQIEKASGKVVKRELILENHSKVMYDPALIPKEELWE